MGEYKRLISYIYSYEKGVKGKNAGFAKIESRNGMCRINISVRFADELLNETEDNRMEVYFFSRTGTEIRKIFLERMKIINGCSVIKIRKSLETLGGEIEHLSGIFICSSAFFKNNKSLNLIYASEWDDIPIEVEAFRKAETFSDLNMKEQNSENILHNQKTELHVAYIGEEEYETINLTENAKEESINAVSGEPFKDTENAAKALLNEQFDEGTDAVVRENFGYQADGVHNEFFWNPTKDTKTESFGYQMEEGKKEACRTEEVKEPCRTEEEMKEPCGYQMNESTEPQADELLTGKFENKVVDLTEESPMSNSMNAGRMPGNKPQRYMSNRMTERRNGQMRNSYVNHNAGNNEGKDFFQVLSGCYPKVRLNEIDGECIKITPHDISYLPKKYWTLCNNSFMLHGYYNYRYLILCEKVVNGTRRYLIGVPGLYHQKEQTIARMFGFTEFEGNKGNGTMNFGYWCMYL